jgi:hypothetical protein
MPQSVDQRNAATADPAARKRALAAARARAAYARRQAGLRVVPVECGEDLVRQLVRHGLIEPEDANNPASLAMAIGAALEDFLLTRESAPAGHRMLRSRR